MRRFLVLGPLETLVDGQPVMIAGGKPRALLARLLIQAPEVVSPDQLVDDLWNGHAPASAGKLVQGYVSQLRRALGADTIRTSPAGYAVEADETDAEEFERLVGAAQERRGSSADAVAILRRANGLWRGRAFADVAYEPWAQVAVARLEELRLVGIEELLEARLQLGESSELVPQLEAFVRENPLRENAWSQLMRALYRAGRQAEALETYRQARERLVDGLGIEPSRALRELEQAILIQDRSLDPVRPGRQRASKALDFVGREHELAEALEALDAALDGSGGLLLIHGEPGIGKTRLADELIAAARLRGAKVLIGRCWEAGGAPPFWPWVQSLRGLTRDFHAAGSESVDMAAGLRQLFPELAEQEASDSDAARFRLFDAVSRFIRRVARESPVVLFLDDMHAADQPSLVLLQFLAREIADSGILIVVAYRDVAPAISEPLQEALGDLIREPHTKRVSLAGLSFDDVSRYVALISGEQTSPTVSAAIVEQTGGNPFYVAEIARMLVAAKPSSHGSSLPLAIPRSVRDAIRRRVQRLSQNSADLLESAAVLGREFAIAELAQLVSRPQSRLLDQLDEALMEGLLIEAEPSSMSFSFTHALIRDTLYQTLNPIRRTSLHRQAGEALEQLYAHDVDRHLTELAHHFLAALPAGTDEKAIEYARRAGDHAARVLAYEEAARLYKSALDLSRDDSVRASLLERRGRVVQLQARLPEAREAFEQAVALYQRAERAIDAGRVLTGLSNVLWRIGDPRKGKPLAEALALLECAPPTAELVGAYAELAGQRALEAAHMDAIDAADRALQLAMTLALPEPARALGYRGQARASLGEREGLDDMHRALKAAVDQGQERAAAVLHNNLAAATWLYDGPESALAACRDGIDFCTKRGIAEWAQYIAGTSLTFLASLGRIEETLNEAEQLITSTPDSGDLPVLIEARSAQLRLHAERGTPAPISAHQLVTHASNSGEPYLIIVGLSAAAELLVAQKDHGRARTLLEQIVDLPHTHEDPRYLALLPGLARCARSIGGAELVLRLVTGVEPLTPLAEHSLTTAKALFADAAGDHITASRLYAEAAERWKHFRNQPEHAYALLGQARTSLTSTQRSPKALLAARDAFTALGYTKALESSEALLAEAPIETG